MAKNKTLILILIIKIILSISLLLTSFNYKAISMESFDSDFEQVEDDWVKYSDLEFAEECNNLISEYFGVEDKCWLKHPQRIMYFDDYWSTLEGECLPCRTQNDFLQQCLLKRFPKDRIRTDIMSCPNEHITIHYQSQVLIDGEWVDVDSYGKKKGVSFGFNLCDGYLNN